MDDRLIKIMGEDQLPFWLCENCHEYCFLGGRWVFLAGKYICEHCVCNAIEEISDTEKPKSSKYIKKETRKKLLKDAFCQICKTKESLEIDHIHPRSKGGESVELNLQVLCKSCNCKKGAKIGEPTT